MGDGSGTGAQPGTGEIAIGIVAGEASGDALAALLIHAVRARIANVRFVGVAGPKMEEAGCEPWVPLETLASRGFTEVLARVPELVRLRRALARRFRAAGIRMFIGVDAPDFNLGLERKLKRRGIRTIHFVSPSVWAWRRERIDTIARSAHRLLALFPFEPPLYARSEIAVTYVGHPLAREAATEASRRDARAELKLPLSQPVFALLPGSRQSELDVHGELVLETAAAIRAQKPDACFLVPLATRPTRDKFEAERFRRGVRSKRPTSPSSRRGPQRSRRRSRAVRTSSSIASRH